jgi:hypothetical protein
MLNRSCPELGKVLRFVFVGSAARHRIIRQMLREFADGVESLSACTTAGHHDSSPTLSDRWRLTYEIRKIVWVNFFLDCGSCKDAGR